LKEYSTLDPREGNIDRINNWIRVHVKELNEENELYKEYLDIYRNSCGIKSDTKNNLFFVFSTGHSGSVWIALLLQMLCPDILTCMHDHETVRSWINLNQIKDDNKKWEKHLIILRDRKKYDDKSFLNTICPKFLLHIDKYMQTYPFVGYSLNGSIGTYYEILKAAKNIYKDSKMVHLIRNGILMVNSRQTFQPFRMIGKENIDKLKYLLPNVYYDNINESIPLIDSAKDKFNIEFIKEYFDNTYRDPFLNEYHDMFIEHSHNNPEYSFFINACIVWKTLNDQIQFDFNNESYIVKIEELTSGNNIEELYKYLIGNIHNEKLFNSAKILALSLDVNRKIKKNIDPNIVWRQWDNKRKGIFRSICADTMKKFDYEMPD
jgi:hypothetical protein